MKIVRMKPIGGAGMSEADKALIQQLKLDMDGVKTDIINLTKTVSDITTTVSELGTDVNSSKTSITNLNSEITSIKTNVTNLSSSISSINTNITKKIGYVYYDIPTERHLGFADLASKNLYVSDPVANASLLLAEWLATPLTTLVLKNGNSDPVPGAVLNINDSVKTTDNQGEATYKLTKGNYSVTFESLNQPPQPISVTTKPAVIPIDLPIYDSDKTYLVIEANVGAAVSLWGVSSAVQINWGDGTIDTSLTHNYTRAGEYTVIITHQSSTVIRLQTNIYLKEIKSIGCVPADAYYDDYYDHMFSSSKKLTKVHPGAFNNLKYAYDFTSCFNDCPELREIPYGLFDSCPNAVGFADCFKGCVSLDMPYNCTSEGLPKLWERKGANCKGFATGAHATFQAGLSPKCFDGYLASVKFSIVMDGQWCNRELSLREYATGIETPLNLSSDLIYKSSVPMKDYTSYEIYDKVNDVVLYTTKTNFISEADYDLGTLLLGDKTLLEKSYIDFNTMTDQEMLSYITFKNNWTIDTIDGVKGFVNTTCDSFDAVPDAGPATSINNLLTFKDGSKYELLLLKNIGAPIGIFILNKDLEFRGGNLIEAEMPFEVGDQLHSVTAISLDGSFTEKCIIKGIGNYIMPTKP